MNLASHMVSSARTHQDRTALRLGDVAVSYRMLDQGSARMAGLLHDRGMKPGDRVAIMLPDVPEFALAYFGVLRAGGIVVPMNPLLKSREVTYYLGNSGAGSCSPGTPSPTRHGPVRSRPRPSRSSSVPAHSTNCWCPAHP
ncbi:AMP-binding protein [Streptomyces sp. NPDC057445]|uniref:AMP-binding protein n=1 Tax=Streptomyces sp. NPDC057445 TaxID=3346136 RepID=UPI00367F71E6